MRFLVVGSFSDFTKTSEFRRFGEAEGKALWELYGAGILLEAHFGKEMSNSALVFECRTLNEAGQFLNTLPSYKSELIKYQICELSTFSKLTEQFEIHQSNLPSWLV